jgi:Lipocalin-like domain
MRKILVLFVCVFAFSCAKVDVVAPLDQLTNGNSKVWTLSEYLVNDKSILVDCLKDDLFFFSKTTGDYTWKVGAVKCAPTDKDQTFKFTLSEDNKTIDVGGNKWQVVSLTDDVFEIKTDIFSGSIHKITYKKLK